MPNITVRAAAEGMPENQPPPNPRQCVMSADKEKAAFFGLEPLLCDTINMLDVLVGMMDSMGLTAKPSGPNHVLTQGEADRLFFVACTAESMSQEARQAYYEALGWDASC
ncbi:MAG: hypothetical protein E5Y67_19425 [Mesorhizobium sp.]|nr:MAG: hypothetical protein E5Y67_19425 [Mesorhizobium sp.]